MATIIQNGILVLPEGPTSADLRIEDGRIAAIGPNLPTEGADVVDADGKLVFPGFIDTHTHFEMNKGLINETADDWVSGTQAALVGGTTCVLDFAEPEKGASLASALETWHGRADGRASCHYSFHMTIKDWNPSIRAELKDMTAAGITSYKVYLAYDALRVSDRMAYEIVQAVGKEGAVIGCHCENGALVTEGIRAQLDAGNLSPAAHPRSRPPVVEAEAVDRWLAIAELAGVPVNIVHLSTQRGLEVIRAARARGQALYVESCPQYFLLTDEKYDLPDFEGAKYVLSPPLRKGTDCAALWQALQTGEIDTIGTDHCSFSFSGPKQLGRTDFSKIPNGMPGVEHRPALMYTAGVASGKMTVAELSRALSENPAKLFGMYPQKGLLAVGSDADIVIFNQNYSGLISAVDQIQNVDYTPYEGFSLRGRTDTVFLNGELVVRSGALIKANRGKFVHRGPSRFWR